MLTIQGKGRICKPTDFYLIVSKIVDRDGNELDLASSNFHFEFFDQDAFARISCEESEIQTYEVSYNGVNRVNNVYKDGVLKFIFGDYPMCDTPKIYYRQREDYPNTDFPDLVENVYTTGSIPISIYSNGVNYATATYFAAVTIMAGDSGGGVPASTIQQWDADVLKEAKAYTDGTVGVIETVLETI